MTTFENAITRAESVLAHVQSAQDTAQKVLEVADRARSRTPIRDEAESEDPGQHATVRVEAVAPKGSQADQTDQDDNDHGPNTPCLAWP